MGIDAFTPLQVIGLLGACLYMTNYALLTVRVLTAEHRSYFVVNLLAAAMVLASLAQAFNMATLAIQVFWIGVSAWGLASRLRRRPAAMPRAARASAPARLPAPAGAAGRVRPGRSGGAPGPAWTPPAG